MNHCTVSLATIRAMALVAACLTLRSSRGGDPVPDGSGSNSDPHCGSKQSSIVRTCTTTNGLLLKAETNKLMLKTGDSLKVAVVLENVTTNSLALRKNDWGGLMLYQADGRPVPPHPTVLAEVDVSLGPEAYTVLQPGQSLTGIVHAALEPPHGKTDEEMIFQGYTTAFAVRPGTYLIQIIRREEDLPVFIQAADGQVRTMSVEEAIRHKHFSGVHMSIPMPIQLQHAP